MNVMKKSLHFLGCAGLALAATACDGAKEAIGNGEIPPPSENREYVIEAQLSNPTRVHIEGTDLKWDDEDCVYVLSSNWAVYETRTVEQDGQTIKQTGIFSGTDAPEPVYRQDYYVAVYQGAPMGAPERSRIAMTVPEEQTYTEGSVAKGALPLIGRWLEDDAQVMFKPVAGVFRIPLYVAEEGVVIEQVELTSPVRNMTGKVALNNLDLPENYNVADPSAEQVDTYVVADEEGSKRVVLKGEMRPGTQAETAAELYMAVAAGDYRDGFTLKITDAEGSTMTVKKPASETELALRPGQMQAFEPLLYKQLAPALTLAVDPDDQGKIAVTPADPDQVEAATTYSIKLYRPAGDGWLPVNETAEEVTLAADAPILLHERMADVAHYLSQGDKCRLELIAARKDGSVYTRQYEFIYYTPKVETGEATIQISVTYTGTKLTITVENPEAFTWENYKTWVLVDKQNDWSMQNAAGFVSATYDATAGTISMTTPALMFPGEHYIQVGCCDDDGDGLPDHVSNEVVYTK